jgi:hypothetical protein
MTLGIQKLQGALPVDVVLPDFTSDGIAKPANILAYAEFPLTGQAGPLQNGIGPIFRTSTADGGRWNQNGHPLGISFWIRIPSGGGGNVVDLYNEGYLSGMNVNFNDAFSLGVTETQITMVDQLNNSQNIGQENTRTISFTKAFNINQHNAGWHHVLASLDRPNETGQLYVDGRNIGWDSISTSGSNAVDNSGEGYSAFSVGGVRKQRQQGVNTVVDYSSLAGAFDICHLGIYQSLNLIGAGTNTIYPRFFDPGTTGRLDGTLTFPTGNPGDTTGTAFPYPLLWAEFNFDSNQGKNVAGASLQPLHDSYTISGSESNIFDATTTFSYEGTGSGSVSEPT